MKRIILLSVVAAIALLVMAGCQMLSPELEEAAAEATGTVTAPDEELVSPVAESDIPIAQATLAATKEPGSPLTNDGAFLPTLTPTPVLPQVRINAQSANVRNGPGLAFDVVAVALEDEVLQQVAVSDDEEWFEVCCFDGQSGWLFAQLVENIDSEVDALISVLPTPTPVASDAASVVQNQPAYELWSTYRSQSINGPEERGYTIRFDPDEWTFVAEGISDSGVEPDRRLEHALIEGCVISLTSGPTQGTDLGREVTLAGRTWRLYTLGAGENGSIQYTDSDFFFDVTSPEGTEQETACTAAAEAVIDSMEVDE